MTLALSIQECPVCHLPITWSNSQTILHRCPNCKSIVSRSNEKNASPIDCLPVLQKNAALTIGFQGKFAGNPFRITGRVQISFEHQTINYWTVIDSNSKVALLAEGYGFYTWCDLVSLRTSITVGQLKSGNIFQLFELQNEQLALLEEREKGNGFFVDGECWFPFLSGEITRYFLQVPDGDSFLLLTAEPDKIAGFKQTDIPADELFQSESVIPFETVKKNCPQCNEVLLFNALPYTKSYCCPHCKNGFYFETATEQVRTFKAEGLNWDCALRPGNKGTIDGVDYQVIGACLKKEENPGSPTWREYTIFNARKGFRTLSEFDGHWMIVEDNPTERPCADALLRDSLKYRGESFPEFNAYSFRVVDAMGEFPYNVFDCEGLSVREFISPPEIWIQQFKKKQSITWAHGIHLSRKQLQTGFPDAVLPYHTGIGAVQPTGYINPAKLMISTITALLVLFLFHRLSTIDRKEVNLLTQKIEFADSLRFVSFVSDTFDLPRRKNLVSIDIFSPLSNSWAYASFRLVNVKTGEEYSMGQGVEYYSGVSGGETWSEGSTSSSGSFVKIPRGRYLLQMDGEKERPEAGSYMTLYVNYDTPSTRNFWFAALFIIIWPVGRLIWDRYTETKRWGGEFFDTE